MPRQFEHYIWYILLSQCFLFYNYSNKVVSNTRPTRGSNAANIRKNWANWSISQKDWVRINSIFFLKFIMRPSRHFKFETSYLTEPFPTWPNLPLPRGRLQNHVNRDLFASKSSVSSHFVVKMSCIKLKNQVDKRGKTAKLYESKSYFVNFNILMGTSWPWEHHKRNIVFKFVFNIINHTRFLCWELEIIRQLRF